MMGKFKLAESHFRLANGLQVHLLPRPDFHQMVAMVTVDFGARDTGYVIGGQSVTQPAGLAHFLEHKLFAQPGYDAFSRLSELGASANAFTTQTRTSYYFASEANNLAALQELLSFTQEPYFEPAAVARESDIISQEIDMYQDDPNATLYRALLGVLYPADPLSEDIAGTRESVAQIGPTDLMEAFEAFYRPNRMDVVVAGAFDDVQVMTLVKSQTIGTRVVGDSMAITAVGEQPVPEIVEIDIETVRNKVALGQRWFEGMPLPVGREALRQAIAISLAVDLVFGEFSPRYMSWYDDGLIDDGFSAEFDWERGFAFLSLAGETPEVETFVDVLSNELTNLAARFEELSGDFELVKKDAIGRLVGKFDNLEDVVTRFEGANFGYATLQDEVAVLESLNALDVADILETATVSPIGAVIARPTIE
jgi:predicted Zn-dependent peptidase